MRKAKSSSTKRISVPRDADAGRIPRQQPPLPNRHSALGEAKRVRGTLEENADVGRRLHANRRKARGQLTVGSAGDAARPTKTGIAATSIQPRRGYGRS